MNYLHNRTTEQRKQYDLDFKPYINKACLFNPEDPEAHKAYIYNPEKHTATPFFIQECIILHEIPQYDLPEDTVFAITKSFPQTFFYAHIDLFKRPHSLNLIDDLKKDATRAFSILYTNFLKPLELTSQQNKIPFATIINPFTCFQYPAVMKLFFTPPKIQWLKNLTQQDFDQFAYGEGEPYHPNQAYYHFITPEYVKQVLALVDEFEPSLEQVMTSTNQMTANVTSARLL